jgi:hypothetical protein
MGRLVCVWAQRTVGSGADGRLVMVDGEDATIALFLCGNIAVARPGLLAPRQG